MFRFRTTYFHVSTLLILLAGCASTPHVPPHAGASPQQLPVWEQALRSDGAMNRYQARFRVKNHTLTGICLLKKTDTGWRGTLMNEMGAKAFDFMIAGAKCRLVNVTPMMDKWYIRKTLAADLAFLFDTDHPHAGYQRTTIRYVENGTLTVRYGKKKKLTRTPDAVITMENLQRNIVYSLEKID